MVTSFPKIAFFHTLEKLLIILNKLWHTFGQQCQFSSFDIFGVVLLSKQIETEGRDQVTPPLHFISLEKFRKHFHRLDCCVKNRANFNTLESVIMK